MTRRRLSVGLGGLAVVAIAVLVAYLLTTQRTIEGGPLGGSDGAGVLVDAFPAGSSITFGLQDLKNRGDSEITVQSVSLDMGEPPIESLGEPVLAYGPGRLNVEETNLFDVRAGWPPARKPFPAVGATIAPNDRIGLELLIALRVPSVEQGIGTLAGVTVTYTADGRKYRKTFSTFLAICPAGHVKKCDDFEPPDDF